MSEELKPIVMEWREIGEGEYAYTEDVKWVAHCMMSPEHDTRVRHITAADVPESVKREIQAEALGRAADKFIGQHYDIPGGLVSLNDVFNYLQEQIVKIREGE